ncbi:histone acetyltransferase type B catalytic subunit [Guyanagaster necrorhizus]|uniref:Histone acetyltransferase type B catalytic subunit n=1 Tax=Guyanagaster necrorhizus TaxID=856835 RepID=A0A9P8AMS9_9AGAR|nr:histone acetyltransferase type B catalytic subunit [Guyanagaster necrorhizus MCA 3950]KAG7441079.1 histone acetyltransferase type B catalytic subunit [Guyanagaster necrorhizus MCA 3950]
MAEWAADSNSALKLSLVRAALDKEVLGDDESYEDFHPTFTYPIFGDDEKIYGYKDLTIDMRFASGSLVQFLSIEYAEKLGASSTVDDVEGTLKDFIPLEYYTDLAEFVAKVEEDASSFKPLGEMIHSYSRPLPAQKGKGKAIESTDTVDFEVYHTTFHTPGFREYHRRMQLFILLYIEAGSYINEDEDQWEFVVLYEKRRRRDGSFTYHFVGYSSLYNFYHFPEKFRLRLSDKAHGSALYSAIYQYILSQGHIAELTVEDPAEAFEDLRDKNDLQMLFAHTKFMQEGFGGDGLSHGGGRVGGVGKSGRSGRGGHSEKGKLGPPVDKHWAEKWRRELKIAGRQFHRLIEMLILSRLDPADLRAYRLQVKERLYRFNFETLAQLEKDERLEKLEETFQSVREDYSRILALVR